MTAMAAAITVNGTHSPLKEETNQEHSPSRFTAVNGRDISSTGANGNMTNGNSSVTTSNGRRDSFESATAATDTGSAPNHQKERPRETVNGSSPTHLDHHSQHSNSQHPSRMSSPHKRKRSDSQDRQTS